jgi:hypothetical protein
MTMVSDAFANPNYFFTTAAGKTINPINKQSKQSLHISKSILPGITDPTNLRKCMMC